LLPSGVAAHPSCTAVGVVVSIGVPSPQSTVAVGVESWVSFADQNLTISWPASVEPPFCIGIGWN
jgi:hypothetical protein